jgi:hypothetical protein
MDSAEFERRLHALDGLRPLNSRTGVWSLRRCACWKNSIKPWTRPTLIEACTQKSPDQGKKEETVPDTMARPSPEPRTVPADRLRALIGIVSLGGDALVDAEALYDGDSG